METIKEYKNYFDTINDKFFNDAVLIVKCMQNCECHSCGSDMFEDSSCLHCNNVHKEVEYQLNKLDSLLKRYSEAIENLPFSKNIIINKFCNLLSSMDAVKSSIVEVFLKKYEYREKYNFVLENALNKMRNMLSENVELADYQLNIIESQLLFSKYRWTKDYTPYTQNDGNKYALPFLFFVKNAGSQKNQISYEAFKQLTIKFTNAEITRALGFFKGGVCKVVDELEQVRSDSHFKTIAYHEYDKIFLSEEIVKQLYSGTSFKAINTIFHELTHMKQYHYGFMYGNHFKDKILSMHLPDYYRDNYYRTSFEREAFSQGYAACNELLKAININPELAYQGYDTSDLVYMFKNYNDPIRLVNGEEKNVGEVFDEFIRAKPDIFKEYEQKYHYLHLFYKLINNEVVPKTSEEIQNDYEKLKAIGVSKFQVPIEELYQDFLKQNEVKL